eukprot:330669_1
MMKMICGKCLSIGIKPIQMRLPMSCLRYSTATQTKSFDIINAIPQSKLDEFYTNGYLVIDEFLLESEVCELEEIYDKFMNGQIHVEGKDFCDMSQQDGFFKSLDEMRMVNAMLPRKYYPAWQNNIYEQKTRALINRLYPQEYAMDIDYDQLLAKKPQQKEAIFSFHQDAAYWPDLKGRNDATCTFSLAIDATTIENGCIAFLKENKPIIREHKPLSDGREETHTIGIELNDNEISRLSYAQVPRGGVSLHNDKIVHGSMGNNTDGWRRTYVIAYRTRETIEYERSIGFTHSHNDEDQIVK